MIGATVTPYRKLVVCRFQSASMMRRVLGILLACVLVAGQWMFYSHALSHAKHEFALAKNVKAGCCPAPLDHPTEYCITFDALGCGATGAQSATTLQTVTAPALQVADRTVPRMAEALPFYSRAPPTVIF
jgi:hypothetical protein